MRDRSLFSLRLNRPDLLGVVATTISPDAEFADVLLDSVVLSHTLSLPVRMPHLVYLAGYRLTIKVASIRPSSAEGEIYFPLLLSPDIKIRRKDHWEYLYRIDRHDPLMDRFWLCGKRRAFSIW